MLGVVSTGLLGGVGKLWMLGTDEVYRCGRDLLICGPPMFERWLEIFSELSNIIAVDNWKAIRLLDRWGFEIGWEEVELHGEGEHREAFVPFSMKRPTAEDNMAAIQATPAFA